jgi:hypothetical protein
MINRLLLFEKTAFALSGLAAAVPNSVASHVKPSRDADI